MEPLLSGSTGQSILTCYFNGSRSSCARPFPVTMGMSVSAWDQWAREGLISVHALGSISDSRCVSGGLCPGCVCDGRCVSLWICVPASSWWVSEAVSGGAVCAGCVLVHLLCAQLCLGA